MNNVREIPAGSGIHGRPILADKLRHIARYKSGAWWTICEQRVPDDHQCPSWDEIMKIPGTFKTCWACDFAWRREQGEWIPTQSV